MSAAAPVSVGFDGVSAELRRARRAQGLSQPDLARLCGVSQTVISEIENARRVPSLRTYERLRAALGLAAPTAALRRRPQSSPATVTEEVLSRLAAALIAGHGGALSDIAAAVGTSAAAVREGLPVLADRFAQVGYELVDDGLSVVLAPAPHAAAAVAHLAALSSPPSLSAEQLTLILVIAHRGQATRRAVEAVVGDDCETLLARLVARGLLSAHRDDTQRRAPNLYRLTGAALLACGHPSLESLQEFLAASVDGELAGRLDGVVEVG